MIITHLIVKAIQIAVLIHFQIYLNKSLCVVVHLFQHNIFLLLKENNEDNVIIIYCGNNVNIPGCNALEFVG